MLFTVSGTGKTMVMDMFYSYVETEKKKRVHFHGFMLDVHKSEFPSIFTEDAQWQTPKAPSTLEVRKGVTNVHLGLYLLLTATRGQLSFQSQMIASEHLKSGSCTYSCKVCSVQWEGK